MGRETKDGAEAAKKHSRSQHCRMVSVEIKLGFFWNEIPPVAQDKLLPLAARFHFQLRWNLVAIQVCSTPVSCLFRGWTVTEITHDWLFILANECIKDPFLLLAGLSFRLWLVLWCLCCVFSRPESGGNLYQPKQEKKTFTCLFLMSSPTL